MCQTVLFRRYQNVFTLLLLFLACDEHLPPREDPTRLFDARLEPSWSLTALENSMYIRLILRSTYDEMIEGTEDITGKISISLVSDPTYTREFTLTGAQVDFAPFYNRSTGFLSIPPGDSVSFILRFDWLDDSGRDVRAVMNYIGDPRCPGRHIAEQEIFLLHGEATLFPRVRTAIAVPILYVLCHADVWVNPKFCPPVKGPLDGCEAIR